MKTALLALLIVSIGNLAQASASSVVQQTATEVIRVTTLEGEPASCAMLESAHAFAKERLQDLDLFHGRYVELQKRKLDLIARGQDIGESLDPELKRLEADIKDLSLLAGGVAPHGFRDQVLDVEILWHTDEKEWALIQLLKDRRVNGQVELSFNSQEISTKLDEAQIEVGPTPLTILFRRRFSIQEYCYKPKLSLRIQIPLKCPESLNCGSYEFARSASIGSMMMGSAPPSYQDSHRSLLDSTGFSSIKAASDGSFSVQSQWVGVENRKDGSRALYLQTLEPIGASDSVGAILRFTAQPLYQKDVIGFEFLSSGLRAEALKAMVDRSLILNSSGVHPSVLSATCDLAEGSIDDKKYLCEFLIRREWVEKLRQDFARELVPLAYFSDGSIEGAFLPLLIGRFGSGYVFDVNGRMFSALQSRDEFDEAVVGRGLGSFLLDVERNKGAQPAHGFPQDRLWCGRVREYRGVVDPKDSRVIVRLSSSDHDVLLDLGARSPMAWSLPLLERAASVRDRVEVCSDPKRVPSIFLKPRFPFSPWHV